MKKEKYEIREIPANQLSLDHTYQRDPIRAHYRRIAEDLDFDSLGTLVVSERADGRKVVVDGQHRLMALREADVAEWEVVCRVYSGLSLEREADLYRQLNRTKKTTAWDDFKAGLVEGDPESVAIDNIVRGCGWDVSNQSRDGHVCCVSALRSIFRKDGGATALTHALEDVTAAWGRTATGVEGNILQGLALVHSTFNGDLDRPSLVKKLAKAKGGPAGILGRARQEREMDPRPIYRLCARGIRGLYNRGRRKGILGEL